MKPKLYLETTIPSYLVARPSRHLYVAANQQITHDWWDFRRGQCDLHISELVVIEAKAGDAAMAARRLQLLEGVPVLAVGNEILELAEELMVAGSIPRKAVRDATHIATAAVYQCEFLLTWNCRHIANAGIQRTLRRVIEDYGHEFPNLCTPQHLMGELAHVERPDR
jgi:hypothetical protein